MQNILQTDHQNITAGQTNMVSSANSDYFYFVVDICSETDLFLVNVLTATAGRYDKLDHDQ